MLLGLSSDDSMSINPGELAAGAGVPHGELLVELVDVLHARRSATSVFTAVDRAIGPAARHDAVAVFANFSMMTRIADATGTPLDHGTGEMSASLRDQLGIDEWVSRRR